MWQNNGQICQKIFSKIKSLESSWSSSTLTVIEARTGPEAEIPSERASNALWKVFARPESFCQKYVLISKFLRLERIFGQLPYI